jgi:uracil DNA glycosylase
MTNKYIGKNWKVVDDIQQAVIRLYIEQVKTQDSAHGAVFSQKSFIKKPGSLMNIITNRFFVRGLWTKNNRETT